MGESSQDEREGIYDRGQNRHSALSRFVGPSASGELGLDRRSLASRSMSIFASGSGLIPLGRMLIIASSLVSSRVMTEIITPTEYGRLALVTGVLGLASLALFSPFRKASMRCIWDWVKGDDANVLISGSLLIFLGIGVAFTLVYWGAMWLGLSFELASSVSIFVVPIFLLAGELDLLLLNLLNTLQHHRAFVIGDTIKAWMSLFLAVGLAVLVGRKAEYVLIGWTFAALAVLVALLVIMSRRGLVTPTFQRPQFVRLWQEMSPYALPFVLVHSLYWIQTSSNRYVLDAFLGTEEVGLFFIAAQVARLPVLTIEMVFSQIHQPTLYRRIGRGNSEAGELDTIAFALKKYCNAYFTIVVPVVLFTVFGYQWLARLLVAQAYWTAMYVIPWVAGAEFVRSLGSLVSNVFDVNRDTRRHVMPTSASAVVTLGGTVVLIPILGIGGAALALLLGALVMLVLNQVLAHRSPFWQFPWRSLVLSTAISFAIVLPAWLVANAAARFGSLVQLMTYLVLFGLAYLVYAGPHIFGMKQEAL